MDTAKKYGIKVYRVPGYSPEAVAEHAMALALAVNRHLHKACLLYTSLQKLITPRSGNNQDISCQYCIRSNKYHDNSYNSEDEIQS